MLISVIVTTYNRPKALDRVLDALNEQEDRGYEVIVGDDGSRDDTRELIDAWKAKYSVRLGHAWQEDLGFRAARVRNLAAARAAGDYLVFLDGDCVPRRDWVGQHRFLAERGFMVAGNRVLVFKSFTKRVEDEKLKLQDFSFGECRKLASRHAINRVAPLVTLPFHPLRKAGSDKWQKIRTCNLGVWAEDFRKVNGFDELFTGWGYEDSDFAVRMLNAGVRRKTGDFATGVFHLYHPENDRGNSEENFSRVMARLKNGMIEAERGLRELS